MGLILNLGTLLNQAHTSTSTSLLSFCFTVMANVFRVHSCRRQPEQAVVCGPRLSQVITLPLSCDRLHCAVLQLVRVPVRPLLRAGGEGGGDGGGGGQEGAGEVLPPHPAVPYQRGQGTPAPPGYTLQSRSQCFYVAKVS